MDINSAQTTNNKSENGNNNNLIKGLNLYNNLQSAAHGQSGFQRLQGLIATIAQAMG